MHIRTGQLFPPPSSSRAQTLKAYILQAILFIVFLATLAMSIVNFNLSDMQIAWALLLLAASCLLGLGLNRQSHFRMAASILIGLAFIVMFYNLYDGGGLHDPGLAAYPVFILFSAFLFGERAVVSSTLLSVGSITLIYLLGEGQWVRFPYAPTLSRALILSLLFLTMGALTWVLYNMWETTLGHLSSSEARLRQITDNMLDLIVQVDAQGRVQYASPSHQTVLGYAPEEIQGHNVMEYMPAEDRAWAEHVFQQLAQGASPTTSSFQGRYRHADGHYLWLEAMAKPIFDKTGRIDGGVIGSRDITARKRAEEVIRRQVEFDELITRLLVRFAGASGAEIDASITSGLQEIAGHVGADHAYIIRVSSDRQTWSATHEWCAAHITPQLAHNQNMPFGTLPWAEALLLGSQVQRLNSLDDYPPEASADRQFQQAEGARSILNVPMRGAAGLVFGIVGLHSHARSTTWSESDIARLAIVGQAMANVLERQEAEVALRESEEKFSRAFERAPVLMTLTDVETGMFVEVNAEAVRLSGFSREELIGKTSLEVGWLSQQDRNHMLAIFREHGRVSGLELTLHAKGGHIIDLLYFNERVTIGGKPHILAIAQDITERKRMQAEMIRSEKLAAMGRMAASLAHELKNPLQVIEGCLTLTESNLGNADLEQQYLAMAREEFARLTTLVQQILDYFRPSKGVRSLTDLRRVVDDVLALSAKQLRQARISVKMEWGTDIPRIMAVDSQLKQVLLNLILNAVEAMPGGGELDIRGERRLEGGDWITLAVCDTGPGIPADELEKTFEPFHTTKASGTGLGLAVCRNLVDQHGGRITVASTPGQGSTFMVWLPCASA